MAYVDLPQAMTGIFCGTCGICVGYSVYPAVTIHVNEHAHVPEIGSVRVDYEGCRGVKEAVHPWLTRVVIRSNK